MKLSTVCWVVVGAAGVVGFAILRLPGEHSRIEPVAVAASTVRKATSQSVEAGPRLESPHQSRNDSAAPRANVADRHARGEPFQREQAPPITPPAADSTSEARLAATKQEEAQRFAEHVATVAAAFEREARDPGWSNQMGAQLESLLGEDDLRGLQYQSIQCRTTTCRVEFEDDGSAATAQALPLLALRTAATVSSILFDRIEHENGRTTFVLYMTRADAS